MGPQSMCWKELINHSLLSRCETEFHNNWLLIFIVPYITSCKFPRKTPDSWYNGSLINVLQRLHQPFMIVHYPDVKLNFTITDDPYPLSHTLYPANSQGRHQMIQWVLDQCVTEILPTIVHDPDVKLNFTITGDPYPSSPTLYPANSQ